MLKLLTSILLAIAFIEGGLALPVKWKNCGQPTDILQISKFDLSGPITPGQNLTVQLGGALSAAVPGGTYTASASVSGVEIWKGNGNLCDVAKGAGAACPIPAGPFDIKQSFDVPASIPAVSASVSLKLTATDGTEILCAQVDATVGPAAVALTAAHVDSIRDEFARHGVLTPSVSKYSKQHLKNALSPVDSLYSTVKRADQRIIDGVNGAPTSTWTAGHNDFFAGWNDAKRRGFMSLRNEVTGFPTKEYNGANSVHLPTTFDARDKWGSCIGPVLNQAECGSCWAFGAIEAASDRMCIEKPHGEFKQLAALDVLTNSDGLFQNNGCQGGQLGLAWNYIQKSGLVTENCLPYGDWEKPIAGPIPTCPADKQPCMPPTFVQTPPPQTQCAEASSIKFADDKHFITDVYNVNGEAAMMQEIFENGPIEGQFTVYNDFPMYKSGVYQAGTSATPLGGHAIKIIGWGEEAGSPYWLVQNSWTVTWGDDGFFKMLRGQDECGIESGAVAGTGFQ